jgi:hypothetical protein
MNEMDAGVPVRGGRMRIPRSRGAASGFLLILLGVWGGLIPFVGPYVGFAYTPDQEWVWTTARGWLEVLPGAATVVGGLLLLSSANRATAMFGGWLSVVAGAWFVVGRAFAGPLGLGDPGAPVATTATKRVWLELCYFSGLGAVIVFLGALALGRLSVRSLRDIQFAHRPVTATKPAPAVEREARTETFESPSSGRHADPASAKFEGLVEAKDMEPAEPRRRGFGGLFRRHRETTTAAR